MKDSNSHFIVITFKEFKWLKKNLTKLSFKLEIFFLFSNEPLLIDAPVLAIP